MSLLNNIVEFPSDAFKIVKHFRHPLPQRTDTIGPWLDCLSFLTWFSALTNSALVYLFHPHAAAAATVKTSETVPGVGRVDTERAALMYEVLGRALFIALAASHGFIVLRALVRHVLERAMWYGSPEKKRLDAASQELKEQYFRSTHCGAVSVAPGAGANAEGTGPAEGEGQRPETPPLDEFWQFDEGLDEIRKGIKDS